MKIIPVNNQKNWNDFILSCSPYTFLHSWQWGQVQQATGDPVQYLGVFSDTTQKQIGAALVIQVNAKRGRHYLVPHGPLARDEATVKQIIPPLISYLKKQPTNSCAVRLTPLLFDETTNRQFFARHNFRPAPLHVHAELTWILDINQPEEALLSGMRKTTRHAIKKAQNQGVTTSLFKDSSALDRFWTLYQQTRHRHHFVPWPYDMLRAQLKIFSADNKIFTIIARYKQQDVASAIIIHFGDTIYYYHGASVKLPGSVPATQLLQWKTIQEGKKRGAKHYNFWGIAPDNQPHHPFAGITTFKKGFGGQAVNYLHAQDYPLSLKYWQLWAIDSYRKIKRGF